MEHFGFSSLRSRSLPEIGGTLHEMEHSKTGARLIWLERPDENKTFGIAFTTLPEDNTGVFHILEHSVLCGSDRYPVKEPFVELLKCSMNTFLNAMTFPDKTFYPVSSRNDKEFLNLMRVYLDAVFHPLIYSKPEIFYQEGWHYEFDENGNSSYQGVVFNEMKGVYANPEEQLEKAMSAMLFPDNPYCFSAGGDPEEIPNLTYEAFLDAHKRFYSPSNAFIVLDGAMDIDQVLSVLDQEYLSGFDRGERIAPPAMQRPVAAGEKRVTYELGQEEDPDCRYRIGWGNVIGTFADKEKLVAMQVLSQVLCASNQSPLPKSILEKGLAENVSMQIRDGVLQPWVVLEVQNCRKDSLSEIEKLIQAELLRLAGDGLDHGQLTAQLANTEFKMRERDYGTMPKGLVFGFNALESWLYGGDPAANLEVGTLFEDLRSKLDQGYFEELLRSVLIENPHNCKVVMEPSQSAGKARRLKEQSRLEQEAAQWSAEEKEALRDRQDRIRIWQETPDTPQALGALPRLQLCDIASDPERIPAEQAELQGIPVILHPIATSGIVYATLYFDVADFHEEMLSSGSLLCSLLGKLPTMNHTAGEIINRIQLLCGFFQCQLRSFPAVNQPLACVRKLCVSFSALEDNLADACDLVTEILTQTRLCDGSAVMDILRQQKTMLSQYFLMSGSSFAAGRVAAQFSAGSVADEYTGGYSFWSWLKQKEEEDDWQVLQNSLQSVMDTVFCTGRLCLSVTGTAPDSAPLAAEKLAEHLPVGSTGQAYPIKPWGKRREGIAVPADISFAVKGGNILDSNGTYGGDLVLASRIIGLGYLWNAIRVQGGAYGAGLLSRHNGLACCYSYRDPNAARSLEQYDGCADYLKELCAAGTDLTGLIIGAVSEDSPLLTPRMQAMTADHRYWCGIDDQMLAQQRQELLHTTPDTQAAIADALRETIVNGGICVIGGQHQLEKCGLTDLLTM